MRSILLDIEGTTTPIDFVHKTLFPYARSKMPAFVAKNFEKLGVEIEQLTVEHEKDIGYTDDFEPAVAKSVAKYIDYLIESDRKSTPLKAIQGEIWKDGYDSGQLSSVVFDDVPVAFERWQAEGVDIAIYSSGSVLAQQLLFRYTNYGDLTPFISNYFDTNVGGKRDVGSYESIAAQLDHPPDQIIFCSDVIAELDAARGAGMQTALSIRAGNAEISEEVTHRIITTFEHLD